MGEIIPFPLKSERARRYVKKLLGSAVVHAKPPAGLRDRVEQAVRGAEPNNPQPDEENTSNLAQELNPELDGGANEQMAKLYEFRGPPKKD